ncbi:hypothetical protein [Sagittula salina]|uniref:Uncharacterized protein n=1 Tax=Sagittula salina TaxID=2820268 RepID=A0A940S4Y7_9RHOB|nr:hypothetical protein [Sagittula salina]MBP0484400.1 hypothetical protein [Sagittula salina]
MLPSTSDTAVSVNGLFVLARDLQRFLGRYSINLIFWTHDETYKVSLRGSGTPIFYRDEYFVICTQHQISGVNPEDISLLTEDGAFAVTSSGYTVPPKCAAGMQQDLEDIIAFNFSDACRDHEALKRRFFKFTEIPATVRNDQVVAILNYGYPFGEQKYDIDENNHIGLCLRATTLLPASQPSDETLIHLKPITDFGFLPDGLSGGPNFVVQESEGARRAYFAGTTVRAGRSDAYIVKSGFIKEVLDAAIDLRL